MLWGLLSIRSVQTTNSSQIPPEEKGNKHFVSFLHSIPFLPLALCLSLFTSDKKGRRPFVYLQACCFFFSVCLCVCVLSINIGKMFGKRLCRVAQHPSRFSVGTFKARFLHVTPRPSSAHKVGSLQSPGDSYMRTVTVFPGHGYVICSFESFPSQWPAQRLSIVLLLYNG